MSDVPWNPVPGWDIPSDYYTPDPPDYDWESLLMSYDNWKTTNPDDRGE